ncbi:MAG: beta-galactosidase [Lachnospiraceae bacterium]|nr:beta-galactosidase [Lachnospiraceae bacterium]
MICRFGEYKETTIEEGHLKLGGENPEGERIDVTSKYLTKGGRPWLPIMGEYHFARADKDDWYTELCKMKAGGIDIVATYLFWIYHQEEEAGFDFKGDLDIRSFVLAAQKAGLQVVLRIGPWAHGECRNGGFPDWLVKKPFKLRDNNEEYLGLVRGWYGAILEQVRGLQYKDGGNIVGIQLENELTDNAPHLKKLKEIAQEVGFDVPLYTVTGWNSLYGAKIPVDDVLPVFGAYPDAPWEPGTHKLPLSRHYAFYTMRNDTAIGKDLIRENSDGWQLPYERYPFATCELGPGMQSTYHRRVYISPMDAYSLSLVKLGCGNDLVGYYMYHGGTNKVGRLSTFNETKATGYPNDYPIINYDFGTCLSQYGEARDSYRYLNLLHLFINDFGEELAGMDHVPAENFVREDDLENIRYCMRRKGDSGFVFVNNHQRGAELKSHKNVSFDTGCGVVIENVDVAKDEAFILPFNIELIAENSVNESKTEASCNAEKTTVMLKYATAQLLCRSGNTFFFMSVDGKKAVYDFEGYGKFICEAGYQNGFTVGGICVMTLKKLEVLYLRKLSGTVYLGDGVDLYENADSCKNRSNNDVETADSVKTGKKPAENEKISAIGSGNYSYSAWTGDGWKKYAVNSKSSNERAVWKMTECEPAFDIEGEAARQLKLSGNENTRLIWKKMEVSNNSGFIVIDWDYDVIQIYGDGKLIADRYYDGAEWRIPASLLYGREIFAVSSLK